MSSSMNNHKLEKNMTLYCKDGQTVVLITFSDRNIWIRYKGELYLRPITAINKTLFFEDPRAKKLPLNMAKIDLPDVDGRKSERIESQVNSALNTIIQTTLNLEDTAEKKSCTNCWFQRSGECSSWDVCDDYQPIYTVSDSEKNYWPTYGDATLFRRKSRKK